MNTSENKNEKEKETKDEDEELLALAISDMKDALELSKTDPINGHVFADRILEVYVKHRLGSEVTELIHYYKQIRKSYA